MAANKDIVAAVNRNGCVTVWTAGDLENIFSSDLGKQVSAVSVDSKRVVILTHCSNRSLGLVYLETTDNGSRH